MSDYIMFHCGVIGDIEFPEQVQADLDRWGFVVDGDSFTEWGEKLTNPRNTGDPIHLTNRGLKSAGPPPNGWLEMRDLLVEIFDGHNEYRVADYIVMTDADVWSEDQEIIGAFA